MYEMVHRCCRGKLGSTCAVRLRRKAVAAVAQWAVAGAEEPVILIVFARLRPGTHDDLVR